MAQSSSKKHLTRTASAPAAAAVQTSNATSRQFLGSAQRPWMSGASGSDSAFRSLWPTENPDNLHSNHSLQIPSHSLQSPDRFPQIPNHSLQIQNPQDNSNTETSTGPSTQPLSQPPDDMSRDRHNPTPTDPPADPQLRVAKRRRGNETQGQGMAGQHLYRNTARTHLELGIPGSQVAPALHQEVLPRANTLPPAYVNPTHMSHNSPSHEQGRSAISNPHRPPVNNTTAYPTLRHRAGVSSTLGSAALVESGGSQRSSGQASTAPRPASAGQRLHLPTPQPSPEISGGRDLSNRLESVLEWHKNRTASALQLADEAAIARLREACLKSDRYFLLTHWIYCIWWRGQPGALDNLHLRTEHHMGISLLAYLFWPNHQLTNTMLEITAKFFPPNWQLVDAVFGDFRSLLESVKTFFSLLGRHLLDFRQWANARGWPPDPAELMKLFHITSPVLQGQIFEMTTRDQSPMPEFLSLVLGLFHQEISTVGWDGLIASRESFRQKCLDVYQFHQPPPPSPEEQHASFDVRYNDWVYLARHVGLVANYPLMQAPPGARSAGGVLPSATFPPRVLLPNPGQQTPCPRYLASPANPEAAPAFLTPNQIHRTVQSTPNERINSMADPQASLPLQRPPTHVPGQHLAVHPQARHSPIYEKVDDLGGSSEKYYRYVEGVLGPLFLVDDSGIVRRGTDISPQLWSRRALNPPQPSDSLYRLRHVWDGCVQFRLKSIISNNERSTPTLSHFCSRPTKWPTVFSVSINGKFGLGFRRQAVHGADMATDVTDRLQEGRNEMSLCVTHSESPGPKPAYVMAIEIVCVANKARVLSLPTCIDAEESLASITAALKSQAHMSGADDEDLVLSQPVLSIDLVDPFTSTVWSTPVRGQECRHRECFDLEAFLQSRTVRGSGLTSPDQWACPICKKDARPPVLVVDGFLVQVRKTLEERGQLGAKAILVKDDGTWTPKFSPAASPDHSSRPAVKNEDTAATRMSGGAEASAPPQGESSASAPGREVVIIIDDD